MSILKKSTLEKQTNLDIISKSEFFFHQNNKNINESDLWVQRIAREHWGQNFYFKRGINDKVFLAFIQKGFIQSTSSDGKTNIAGPGSVFFIKPESTQLLQSTELAGTHLIVSTFSGEIGRKLAKKTLGSESTAISLTDPSRVESLFYRVFESGEKGGLNAAVIAAALIPPLLLTIEQEHKTHETASDQTLATFSKCKTYIDNNWKSIKSVKEVPNIFNISQPTMNTLFKRCEDCTPHHYLLQKKMSYALYQIQQGNQKITHLAHELGFADAYSFSKTFKRLTGTSPGKMKA